MTSERRLKRDAGNPHLAGTQKRGDWAKTNMHMWGKRQSELPWNFLQDEAASGRKRNTWGKNNVRMWGKRNYNDDDYFDGDWFSREDVDSPFTYDKRDSETSSTIDDSGQMVPHGWAKNAWERNNMRIWG